MALKPCPRTAVLVQESVVAAIHSQGYSEDEKEDLQEFATSIDQYLLSSTL